MPPTPYTGSGVTIFFNVVDAAFKEALAYAQTALSGLGSLFTAAGGTVGIFTAAVGLAADALRSFSEAYKEQEEAEKQLQAALNATGKHLQLSVRDLANYASTLEKTTKFTDESIIASMKYFAQLRRFPAEEVKRATKLALDMAEGQGMTDPAGAFVQLGKAIEDPRRASRSLMSARVMLTTAERETIESLDMMGRYREAVEVILNAVNRAYGGSAELMAKTMAGQQTQIRGLIDDLKKFSGYVFNEFSLPIVSATRDVLRDWSSSMDDMTDAMKAPREALEDWMRKLGTYEGQLQKLTGQQVNAMSPESWELLKQKIKESTTELEVWGEWVGRGIKMGGDILANFVKNLSIVSQIVGKVTGINLGPIDTDRILAEQKNLDELLATREIERKRAAGRVSDEEQDAFEKRVAAEKDFADAQEKAQKDALKDREREVERYYRHLDRLREKYYEDTRSDEEKAMDRVKEIKTLWGEGLLKGPEGTDLYLRSMDLIRKDYVDAAKYAKEIEKSSEKLVDDQEKVAALDKRLKKKNEFTASIESLVGMWERIQSGAASRKDDPVKELQEQRKEAAAQARRREQQLNELIQLQNQRIVFAQASFG